MKWTPVAATPIALPRDPNYPTYFTLAEDTHFGVWQRQRGFVDEALMRHILPHIPPGSVAIDGGSFNGEHAIAYSRFAGLVYAFEPQLPAFLCLATNVFLGQHWNIIPVRAALSDESNPREFVYRFPDWTGAVDNYGARSGKAIIDRSTVEPWDAPIVVLDRFLGIRAKRIGFVKLDLEGAELRALRGARAVLDLYRPNMWIEVNAGTLARFGATPDDLLRYIRDDLRYDVTAGTGREGGEQWDALCVPRRA